MSKDTYIERLSEIENKLNSVTGRLILLSNLSNTAKEAHGICLEIGSEITEIINDMMDEEVQDE